MGTITVMAVNMKFHMKLIDQISKKEIFSGEIAGWDGLPTKTHNILQIKKLYDAGYESVDLQIWIERCSGTINRTKLR